jgi:hypothetical protein
MSRHNPCVDHLNQLKQKRIPRSGLHLPTTDDPNSQEYKLKKEMTNELSFEGNSFATCFLACPQGLPDGLDPGRWVTCQLNVCAKFDRLRGQTARNSSHPPPYPSYHRWPWYLYSTHPALIWHTGHIDLSKRCVSPEDITKCKERFMKARTISSIMRHVASRLPPFNPDPGDGSASMPSDAKKDRDEESDGSAAVDETVAPAGPSKEERLEKLYEQIICGHSGGNTGTCTMIFFFFWKVTLFFVHTQGDYDFVPADPDQLLDRSDVTAGDFWEQYHPLDIVILKLIFILCAL